MSTFNVFFYVHPQWHCTQTHECKAINGKNCVCCCISLKNQSLNSSKWCLHNEYDKEKGTYGHVYTTPINNTLDGEKKNTLQQEVLRCSWTRTEMFWERGSKSLVVYCRSSITHPMPSTILGKVYNKSSSRAEQCWHKAILWQFSILTVILAGCQMVIVIWRLRGSTMGKSRTY